MLLKHVQVGLSDRDDRESSFNRCGSPVSLVQACLCGAKAWYYRLNLGGGAVKHMDSWLSARDDRESSFPHCGGPVRLVQACLCAEKTW